MNPLFANLLPTMLLARSHTFSLHFNWSAGPLLALVAGVLILVRPKLLNLIVAFYLIAVGLMGLFYHL